jgi:hypothetical protein
MFNVNIFHLSIVVSDRVVPAPRSALCWHRNRIHDAALAPSTQHRHPRLQERHKEKFPFPRRRRGARCQLCALECEDRADLRRHMEARHVGPLVSCHLCTFQVSALHLAGLALISLFRTSVPDPVASSNGSGYFDQYPA